MARTPPFAFRLSPTSKANLVEMARIYGSANVSVFAREVLETISSGDIQKIRAFTLRMAQKAGEQLNLSLNASFDEAAKAQKPAKQARKPASRGKPAQRSKKA